MRPQAHPTVLTVVLGLALVGAASAAPPETVERRVMVMGTYADLVVEADSRAAALAGSEAAIAALQESEARLSTWGETSELARLNRAPVGEALALSPALFEELSRAEACRRATGGAFDARVGPLVAVWGLRTGGRLPADREIEAARRDGAAELMLREDGSAARTASGLRLEEGGFGKGAGLDAAVAAVAGTPGVLRVEIDLGGQVSVWRRAAGAAATVGQEGGRGQAPPLHPGSGGVVPTSVGLEGGRGQAPPLHSETGEEPRVARGAFPRSVPVTTGPVEGGRGQAPPLHPVFAGMGRTPTGSEGIHPEAGSPGVDSLATAFEISVAHPDERARPVLALAVGSGSVATSGNSERGIVVGGERMSHLLDPRTGRPATDFGSVTVWAPTALEADCLSTALYVMGPEAALAWAAAHPGVEVLVLRRGPKITPGAATPRTGPREETAPGMRLQALVTPGLAPRLVPLDEGIDVAVWKAPAAAIERAGHETGGEAAEALVGDGSTPPSPIDAGAGRQNALVRPRSPRSIQVDA